MSYEYEEESKRKMSFGQILLSLLLLGVVVVIGLIVLVYFKLTSPEKRVAMPTQEASAPVREVERMTPDGKPARGPAPNVNLVNGNASASSPTTANARRQSADDAVNEINKGVNPNPTFSSRALTNGAAGQTAPKRTYRPRRTTNPDGTEPTTRSRRNSTTQQGEVPLQPINRERPLTPRNQSGERELTPRRSNTNESTHRPIRLAPSGEQKLEPIQPKNNRQSGSVDKLF